MPIPLSATTIKKIHGSLDDLFDKLKVKLIGPQSVPKSVRIGVIHEFTLPGLFAAAAAEEGVAPHFDSLVAALGIADSYIEAYRDIAKARVVREVQAFLTDAENKGIKTDIQTVLGGKLSDVWTDVSDSVHQIVDSEANAVKNLGITEGIIQMNAESSIDDPVVYFVVVRDEHTCSECKRLHLMGDGHTPRLWYMSEIGSGYHKKGDDTPKFSGLHPHCRCTLAGILPGYGFDDGGGQEYKRQGYDAMAVQRHLERMEAMGDFPGLKKWTPAGLPHFENFVRARAEENAAREGGRIGSEITTPDPLLIQHLATAPIAVQFPKKNLIYFESDPRFKNLGVVGTGRGSTSHNSRKAAESVVLGIENERPWEERPVYGALLLNHHLLYSGQHQWRRLCPAEQYGELFGIVRPHIIDRSTVTPGDSFGADSKTVFLPKHMEAMAKRMVSGGYGYGYSGMAKAITEAAQNKILYGGYDYIEAQIHGGLSFSDLAELHIDDGFDETQASSSDFPESLTVAGSKDRIRRYDETPDYDKSYYFPRGRPAEVTPEMEAASNEGRMEFSRYSVENLRQLCKRHGVKLIQHHKLYGENNVKPVVVYDPMADPAAEWEAPTDSAAVSTDTIFAPKAPQQQPEQPFVPAPREDDVAISGKKKRKPRTKKILTPSEAAAKEIMAAMMPKSSPKPRKPRAPKAIAPTKEVDKS